MHYIFWKYKQDVSHLDPSKRKLLFLEVFKRTFSTSLMDMIFILGLGKAEKSHVDIRWLKEASLSGWSCLNNISGKDINTEEKDRDCKSDKILLSPWFLRSATEPLDPMRIQCLGQSTSSGWMLAVTSDWTHHRCDILSKHGNSLIGKPDACLKILNGTTSRWPAFLALGMFGHLLVFNNNVA